MPSDTQIQTASPSRIGDSLKEAREKRSLTIEAAQKQTRINATVLRALEEGTCDAMLNPTYVKSFLKQYAEFLGLDGRALLSDYTSLHPELRPQKMHLQSSQATAPAPEEADYSKIIAVAKTGAIIITGLILALFLAGKTVSFIKASRASKQPAVTAKTAQSRKAKEARSAKTRLQQPAQAAKKSAPASLDIPKGAPFSVVIKTKSPVWVEVKKDGQAIYKTLMPKNTIETFKVNDKLELYVAKAEAIEIIVNGKSLGSPGTGVIKRLAITREGIATE